LRPVLFHSCQASVNVESNSKVHIRSLAGEFLAGEGDGMIVPAGKNFVAVRHK
jgi:hypothetical protein